MADQSVTAAPLPAAITQVFDRINGGINSQNAPGYRPATTESVLIESIGSNKNQGRDPLSRGVYAGWPAMTPKYMRHMAKNGFFGTLARMYVRVPGGQAYYNRLINTFTDKPTQDIAKKLMGDGNGKYGGLGYIDFFLQQAGHSVAEKFQVVPHGNIIPAQPDLLIFHGPLAHRDHSLPPPFPSPSFRTSVTFILRAGAWARRSRSRSAANTWTAPRTFISPAPGQRPRWPTSTSRCPRDSLISYETS